MPATRSPTARSGAMPKTRWWSAAAAAHVAEAMTRAGQNVALYPGGWRLARPDPGAQAASMGEERAAAGADAGGASSSACTTLMHGGAGHRRLLGRRLLHLYRQRSAGSGSRPAASEEMHAAPSPRGAVPIRAGMAACLLLGLAALGSARLLGAPFFWIVALYMALSLAYSLRLKRLRWIDIATLAALYTLRVIAGAAAAQVYVSGYLLVWVFPVFVALGVGQAADRTDAGQIRRAAARPRLWPARPRRPVERRRARRVRRAADLLPLHLLGPGGDALSDPLAALGGDAADGRLAGPHGLARLRRASRTTTRSSSPCATSAGSG